MGYEELNVVNPESAEAQQGPTGKADVRIHAGLELRIGARLTQQ